MGKSLLTVSLFECNINTTVFNSWVEQDLILKLPKNSVIVMYNGTVARSGEMANKFQFSIGISTQGENNVKFQLF